MTENLDSFMPWFTLVVGVIIGVLTSLAASYVKPLIDNQLAKYSSRVRNRNEARRTEWEAEVSSLIGDSEKRHQYSTKANTCFLTGINFLLFAIWIFLLISVVHFVPLDGESENVLNIVKTFTGFLFYIGLIIATFLFATGAKEGMRGNRYLHMVSDSEKRVQIEKTNKSGEANAENEVQQGSER